MKEITSFCTVDNMSMFTAFFEKDTSYDPTDSNISIPAEAFLAEKPSELPARWDADKEEWRYPSRQPCVWHIGRQDWVWSHDPKLFDIAPTNIEDVE